MKTNLNPQVFRDAAARIVTKQNYFCCDSIQLITKNRESSFDKYAPHQAFFQSYFKPKQAYGLGWWSEGEVEARALALLLCADILESERKRNRKA